MATGSHPECDIGPAYSQFLKENIRQVFVVMLSGVNLANVEVRKAFQRLYDRSDLHEVGPSPGDHGEALYGRHRNFVVQQ